MTPRVPFSTAAPPKLRNIRGPSALSGTPKRFWWLIWQLARTDFVLKYKGSIFGYLWSLVSPIMLFGVIYLTFTQILRFGNDVNGYAAFLLLNIMLFAFFEDASARSLVSIVSGESLVRKMDFPRLAIPLSLVLAATFTLVLDLIVVMGYFVVLDQPVRPTWLLLPVLIVWLYVFTVGCSLLLSTLFVRFRDTAQIWTILLRVLFYGSPILYPIELFPESWKFVLLLNPLAPLFNQARIWMVDPSAPSVAEVVGGWGYVLIPTAIFVFIVVWGVLFFSQEAPRVAEEI